MVLSHSERKTWRTMGVLSDSGSCSLNFHQIMREALSTSFLDEIFANDHNQSRRDFREFRVPKGKTSWWGFSLFLQQWTANKDHNFEKFILQQFVIHLPNIVFAWFCFLRKGYIICHPLFPRNVAFKLSNYVQCKELFSLGKKSC